MIARVIGALVACFVIIIVITSLNSVVSQVTNPSGTTTTTSVASVAGTPLMPTSVIPWIVAETLMICGLIIPWYFYHYVPHSKRRRTKHAQQ